LLSRAGIDANALAAMIRTLCEDPVAAGTNEAERTMLAFAVKLTGTPAEMTAADVASLRASGFDDRAIHDICAIVAYFAFVNRMADGLGVELEPRFSV
jgi:uncharacterized peroxidase-related enzyme